MTLLVRQLDNSSPGSKLRSLRKKQGITLSEISANTHVSTKHLEAFENDAYHELPDPLYARHFLKMFVTEINGDVDYFLERFDEECGSTPAHVAKLQMPRQRIGKQLLTQWRSIAGKIGIGILAILLLTYIGSQIHTLLSPPNLLVDSPPNDIQTTNASIEVSGQTDKEVSVTINNDPVLTDPTGRFTSTVTLTRGLNIITIEATKKYGKPQTIHRTVFLEDLGRTR